MNANQAISALYRAIEEKTEKGVSNALDNHPVELHQRTDILRRMFADEQRARDALARAMRRMFADEQRARDALARAMRTITQYIDN